MSPHADALAVGGQGHGACKGRLTSLTWTPVVLQVCEPAMLGWAAAGRDDTVRSAYRERAHLVALLASRYRSVLADDPVGEPGFRTVVYVHTPEGQLSWHIADGDLDVFEHLPRVDSGDVRAQWDGHTTEEKYGRVRRLTRAGGQAAALEESNRLEQQP